MARCHIECTTHAFNGLAGFGMRWRMLPCRLLDASRAGASVRILFSCDCALWRFHASSHVAPTLPSLLPRFQMSMMASLPPRLLRCD